jgi:hypothetical protein
MILAPGVAGYPLGFVKGYYLVGAPRPDTGVGTNGLKENRSATLRARDHPAGNRLPVAVAGITLIGDEVSVFRVHEFIAMALA